MWPSTYKQSWGGAYYNQRGLSAVTVAFSSDGANFSSDELFSPAAAPELAESLHEEFLFAGMQSRVTHVRFTEMANHDPNGGLTGFGEVRFLIPEPSTMVFAASALLGLVAFGRKRLH